MADEKTAKLHSIADQLAAAAGIVTKKDDLQAISGAVPPSIPSPLAGPLRATVAHQLPTIANAESLVSKFENYLDDAGVIADASLQLDVLGAYLSTQFLLVAGPSGTGKSTIARALAEFFCPPDSWRVIEARRQLIGPEDIAGYYSILTNIYAWTSDLNALLEIGAAAPESAPPALLVEEINLSPVEGYLAPFTHGLSDVSAATVSWPLHDTELDTPPKDLVFEPFPRLLGTINVDSTSVAPAPKVAARACVILLEPQATPNVDEALNALRKTERPKGGGGAEYVGDPLEILDCPDIAPDSLRKQIEDLLTQLVPPQGEHFVSRRQVGQMLLYVAWYSLMAQAFSQRGGVVVGDPYRIGAENALLHFILPTLSPRDFGTAIQRLNDASIQLHPAPDQSSGGSVLKSRIDRLSSSAGSGMVGGLLDFWDRLS